MFKVPAPQKELTKATKAVLRKYSLNTVCEESLCPNIGECFSQGHATFLILGKVCTRACKYCHVATGKPKPPDPSEPFRLYLAVKELALSYVVITSVDRDDLEDYGAGHYARCVEFLKSRIENIKVEVLTPDFNAHPLALERVIKAKPDVLAHNIETVEGLFKRVRPQGDYKRSLEVLRFYSKEGSVPVKSGIMVGLGETKEELKKTFEDLLKAGVSYLVIGQYLSPGKGYYPVQKYYTKEEFDELKEIALSMGFKRVLSEPLARSSYHAQKLAGP
ncbi:MAG: lipoyl synthase [Aquificota bacterium]|nr:MAG: lipoyl synthase [Aquificota bacterium]